MIRSHESEHAFELSRLLHLLCLLAIDTLDTVIIDKCVELSVSLFQIIILWLTALSDLLIVTCSCAFMGEALAIRG